MNPAAERVAEEKASVNPVKTYEQFQAEQPDPVKVAADLSHELQEALGRIDDLTAANRELGTLLQRAEAVRDVLKELLIEGMRR